VEGSPAAVTRRSVREDIEWIAISGELDMASAPEASASLLGAIKAGHQPKVVLDLSQLRFIDSTGVQVLLRAAAARRLRGGELIVVGCSPGVRRILDQAGIAGALHFVSSPDEVLD
jgi:stage II sporulation protein AA (anti-sigma F factor antagonist)